MVSMRVRGQHRAPSKVVLQNESSYWNDATGQKCLLSKCIKLLSSKQSSWGEWKFNYLVLKCFISSNLIHALFLDGLVAVLNFISVGCQINKLSHRHFETLFSLTFQSKCLVDICLVEHTRIENSEKSWLCRCCRSIRWGEKSWQLFLVNFFYRFQIHYKIHTGMSDVSRLSHWNLVEHSVISLCK